MIRLLFLAYVAVLLFSSLLTKQSFDDAQSGGIFIFVNAFSTALRRGRRTVISEIAAASAEESKWKTSLRLFTPYFASTGEKKSDVKINKIGEKVILSPPPSSPRAAAYIKIEKMAAVGVRSNNSSDNKKNRNKFGRSLWAPPTISSMLKSSSLSASSSSPEFEKKLDSKKNNETNPDGDDDNDGDNKTDAINGRGRFPITRRDWRISQNGNKKNPLSNFIQFETMFELAKLASTSNINGTTSKANNGDIENGAIRSDSGSNTNDIFSTVDRLLKMFEKQQQEATKKRSTKDDERISQLSQFDTRVIDRRDDADDRAAASVPIRGCVDRESDATDDDEVTTIEDLMRLQEYVGKINLFRNQKYNVWDVYSAGNTAKSRDEKNKEENVEATDANNIVTAELKIDDASKDNNDQDLSSAGGIEVTNATPTNSTTINLSQTVESILKDATARIEYLVAEASSAFELSPNITNVKGSSAIISSLDTTTSYNNTIVEDVIARTSDVLNSTITTYSKTPSSPSLSTNTVSMGGTITIESLSNDIVSAAQNLAKESGLDINFATDRAREATEFAVGVASTANVVLNSGYAYGSRSGVSGVEGGERGSRTDISNNIDLNFLAAQTTVAAAGSAFFPAPVPSSTSDESTSKDPSFVAEYQQQQQHQMQKPLFGQFSTAARVEPYEYRNVVIKGAAMGRLAGAVYEDTIERCHELGHSLVANGITSNVAWMVTDSLGKGMKELNDESLSSDIIMVRTITIRGFDASDESVDREALLNEICTATPVPINDAELADDASDSTFLSDNMNHVLFHKGLLAVAKQIYADTKNYIDWLSPNHKLVLNGHSVGGSLSVLILLLIVREKGVEYVQDQILRVYTHGSPPVATTLNPANKTEVSSEGINPHSDGIYCAVLDAFGLPASIVYGYIQPYDPVVRLFSGAHDVLYPLVDDLGSDGVTLYASGPIRSLRPITRAIFQAWNGWPQFRDNWKETANQQYKSVGVQYIFLPEPLRYLNDRFISVNVGVPPTEAIVKISPDQLLPALDATFPLDVFQVSLVPQAVRSFLHHFYPAYDAPINEYSTKIRNEFLYNPMSSETTKKKANKNKGAEGNTGNDKIGNNEDINIAFKPFRIKRSD